MRGFLMAAAAEVDTYTFVDSIPELAVARDEVRHYAETVLEDRRQGLVIGEAQPLQIDALSTAHYVIEARTLQGENSALYTERLSALQLDCQRLVGEWYRKNTWEYFPKSRHYFDAQTGDFYSHGLSIRQMTENALTPHLGNAEEEARRVNEYVENETPQIIHKLGMAALKGVNLRTVSECTDQALIDYEHDQRTGAMHRGYRGYVPEINKKMIRDITFDELTGDRIEEQIGISGIYIDDWVTREALHRRGLDAKNLGKTELHGHQIVASDDLIDFVALLDEVASEQWCVPVFMGEKIEPGQAKDYKRVRTEAAQRQAELRGHADMVADFLISIAEEQTDPREAPMLVEEFVKSMLLRLAASDQTLAAQIFDERTASGLAEVARLSAVGSNELALELFMQVQEQAPGGGFCGAGSCGLEAIDLQNTNDVDALKRLGFDTKDSIKDTERHCKCGAKAVYYDLKKAKKGCGACNRTKSYK